MSLLLAPRGCPLGGYFCPYVCMYMYMYVCVIRVGCVYVCKEYEIQLGRGKAG
jgi:hypothetical protein